MRLNIVNTFNMKNVQQMLRDEDQFISDIFSTMPLPTRGLDDEFDESDDEDDLQQKNTKLFPTNGAAKRAQSFSELHDKLNSLKGVKKLSYKLKQEKKGLKNRIKKKTKRDERMLQKKLARTENIAAGGTRVKIEEVEGAPKVSRPKPVFNSEGHMVFSKFDFSEIGTKKKLSKTEKDPKKALQQLTERKNKLKSLVESGETEKAEEMKEKEAWKTALAKAGGEKVKDDEELLKKSIKREDQKKKDSSKKWESRISGVEKAQQEKQQKRQDNILKRKKDKKTNKLKKASKKGRIIPGF